MMLARIGHELLRPTVHCPVIGASRLVSECIGCIRLRNIRPDGAFQCEVDETKTSDVIGSVPVDESRCVYAQVPIFRIDLTEWESAGFVPVVRSTGRFTGAVLLQELRVCKFDALRPIGSCSFVDLAVHEDMSLSAAVHYMVRRAARALAVVDRSGNFISLVTDTTLLRSMRRKD